MTSSLLVANPIRRTALSALVPQVGGSGLLYGTVGLLLFGPLAFGETNPWSIFVLEAGSALLFVLWVVRQVRSESLSVRKNRLFLPMLVFGALIVLQIVTGETASMEQTLSCGMQFGAYGILSFLLVQSLRETEQVYALARAISIYGTAMALFGIIYSLTANGKLYWFASIRFGGWIYGPYVNHNHYAGLMEMLTPIPLAVALSHNVSIKNRCFAGAATALMASSIFLSGSRGGMIAFVAEILVLVFLLLRLKGGTLNLRIIVVILFFVLICLAWVGTPMLGERISSIHDATGSELSDGTRWSMDRDAIKMFSQRPLLGWGLGAFPIVHPQFRSFYTDLFVDHAHNDYLQLVVEMGIAGLGAAVWFLTIAIFGALRKLRHHGFHLNGMIGLAAILGICGILVHSLVDFNLEIPANAAIFYVLCTLAATKLTL